MKGLKFYDVKKVLPEQGQRVLIKYGKKYGGDEIVDKGYYECYYDHVSEGGEMAFIEACGEEWYCFYVEDVVGWMPIEDLDIIEVE